MNRQSGLAPYVPAAVEDEPLDGWVSRIADGLMTSPAALLRHWGIRPPANLLRDADPTCLHTLCEVTGLSTHELKLMTLARWEQLGLRPAITKRGHDGGAWSRGTGSRHCPECLDERHGVFRLQWSLQWSFACIRHKTLLAPTTAATHRHDQRYGTSTAAPSYLSPGHPLLATQRTLDDYLARPAGRVDSILGERPIWEVFTDLGALARMVLTSPVAESPVDLRNELARRDGLDWSGLSLHLPTDLAGRPPGCKLAAATSHPALLGLAATAALRVLAGHDPSAAAAELWWAPPAARQEAAYHARTRQFSWPLVQALSSDAPTRRQARSLLLTRFDLARFDEHHQRLSPLDPAKIPASCWPILHPEGVRQDPSISAVSASAALAMVATGRRAKGALDRLGLGYLAGRIEADWDQAFDATEAGHRNFADLLALHRALVAGIVPIDYDRRRRTFPEPEPITRRTENRISGALERRITSRESRFVAWYLWELLTGSDALITERTLNTHLAARVQHRAQRTAWRKQKPEILHELAVTRLRRLRINEPLTWEPSKCDGRWFALTDETETTTSGELTGSQLMVRGPSRAPAVQELGYDFETAVAFAASAQTTAGRHLARNLVRFFVVSQTGSLKKAASYLGVTGGTLSVQIRDLERSLSVMLFDRHATALVLRPDGQRLASLIRHQAPGLLAGLDPSLRELQA